jgi:hypothetical protein
MRYGHILRSSQIKRLKKKIRLEYLFFITIGSKQDKHKMSMMYFLLQHISDQYWSQPDFIHLVDIH